MALQAYSLERVLAMTEERREWYFNHFAGYFPRSPQKRYAIRVGSVTLHSNDTMQLREQFNAHLKAVTT